MRDIDIMAQSRKESNVFDALNQAKVNREKDKKTELDKLEQQYENTIETVTQSSAKSAVKTEIFKSLKKDIKRNKREMESAIEQEYKTQCKNIIQNEITKIEADSEKKNIQMLRDLKTKVLKMVVVIFKEYHTKILPSIPWSYFWIKINTLIKYIDQMINTKKTPLQMIRPITEDLSNFELSTDAQERYYCLYYITKKYATTENLDNIEAVIKFYNCIKSLDAASEIKQSFASGTGDHYEKYRDYIIREITASDVCIICHAVDKNKDYVSLQCGGGIICCQCVKKLENKCPICRSSFISREIIYINRYKLGFATTTLIKIYSLLEAEDKPYLHSLFPQLRESLTPGVKL